MKRRSLPIRAASIVSIVGLRIYTFVTKRPRVRVLVTNEFDEVLLLRTYISHGRWSLPGGGVGRNEPHVMAAKRELHEETGIDVSVESLTYVKTLSKPEIAIPFVAPLYHAKVKRTELPEKAHNPHEVMEVQWFRIDRLPDSLSIIAVAALVHIERQR